LTFATINSIIYFNNVEIVDHLYKDTTFLTELYVPPLFLSRSSCYSFLLLRCCCCRLC
jgi:hypothetical protein